MASPSALTLPAAAPARHFPISRRGRRAPRRQHPTGPLGGRDVRPCAGARSAARSGRASIVARDGPGLTISTVMDVLKRLAVGDSLQRHLAKECPNLPALRDCPQVPARVSPSTSHLRTSPTTTSTKATPMLWHRQRKPAKANKVPSSKMAPQVEHKSASGSHLRQGDVKRKGADLSVAPLKLNVRLSKCGPRSVEPLRGLAKPRNP